MRFMLFNWNKLDEKSLQKANDPSDLTDEEFFQLSARYGYVWDSAEDFESAFNAELFSTETHQLRITE